MRTTLFQACREVARGTLIKIKTILRIGRSALLRVYGRLRPRPGALLHIGSGSQRIEGWVNIDKEPLPGVDLILDVTRGLHFKRARGIFCEHFLEHLTLEEAVRFLIFARRALAAEGRIRISTPNLDYVWLTHYRVGGDQRSAMRSALRLNRAFHGWGHRFLWNEALLQAVVTACGFRDVRWVRRGESDYGPFAGLERHKPYLGRSQYSDVLIVEARNGPDDRVSSSEVLELIASWREVGD